MPKEGFQSITIRNVTYDKLCELAQKLGMSLPEALQYIVQNCKIETPTVEVTENASKN
jgi:macrodomain Ter protein organizer (MatP/YcbG family)